MLNRYMKLTLVVAMGLMAGGQLIAMEKASEHVTQQSSVPTGPKESAALGCQVQAVDPRPVLGSRYKVPTGSHEPSLESVRWWMDPFEDEATKKLEIEKVDLEKTVDQTKSIHTLGWFFKNKTKSTKEQLLYVGDIVPGLGGMTVKEGDVIYVVEPGVVSINGMIHQTELR